jgi:hypothetical protein
VFPHELGTFGWERLLEDSLTDFLTDFGVQAGVCNFVLQLAMYDGENSFWLIGMSGGVCGLGRGGGCWLGGDRVAGISWTSSTS